MNYDTIIVRYSEIFLKSDFVRNQLEKKLSENIKSGIKTREITAKLTRERGRIFITTSQTEEISCLLKHVFGVLSFSPAIKIRLGQLEDFVKINAEKMLKGKTFAARVKREGVHEFTSKEMGARLGEIVIEATNKKVDLTNPKSELFVEVRDQDVYVFTEKVFGPGGISLGSQGRVNCFVDSDEGLAACWLMMKRGCTPNIYHTISVDALDKWSYGNKLKKIRVKSIEEVGSDHPLVVGDRLEKDGIKRYDGFATVLAPIIAFTKDEINQSVKKINT